MLLKPWWGPRYFVCKMRRAGYRKKYPDTPWFNRRAIAILSSMLKPSGTGLEWGSGSSTTWLAQRLCHLTTVEHNSVWYARVRSRLAELGLMNVTCVLCPDTADYVATLERFSESSLDFVLIDGGPRSLGANRAVNLLRPGGVLVVDDAHRFLASESRSPKARHPDQGPRFSTSYERTEGTTWANLLSRTRQWQCLWTSDGVTDTAIWIKPGK